jgi:hypothetical protein
MQQYKIVYIMYILIFWNFLENILRDFFINISITTNFWRNFSMLFFEKYFNENYFIEKNLANFSLTNFFVGSFFQDFFG